MRPKAIPLPILLWRNALSERTCAVLVCLVGFLVGLLALAEAPLNLRLAVADLPAPDGTTTLDVTVVTRVKADVDAENDADAGQADSNKDGAATPTVPASGVAANGVAVRVLWEDLEHRFVEVARKTTDENGNLRFEKLRQGRVWVIADKAGLRRVSRSLLLSAEHRLELVLSPAHALAVRVVDEEQTPIVKATVLARDGDALPFGALTDAQGGAVFSRLGPAPWKVEVFARGYESANREGVEQDTEFVLRRLAMIRAHVTTSNGNPAVGAQVLIVGASLWPPRRAVTDQNGDALIPGLLPGSYDLKAQLGGQVSPGVSSVSLERGEHKRVELRLAQGRTLTVLVVDDFDGYDEPVADADVALADFGVSSFPITARTGRDGKAFLGPITLAPGYVSVGAAGFIGRNAVPVPPDLTQPLRVVLLRGAKLRGTVVDELGRPIDGARVEVIGTDVDGLPIAQSPLLAAFRSAHFEWSLQPLPLIPTGELGVTSGPVPFVSEALTGQSWAVLPESYTPWISDFEGEFVAQPVSPGKLRALVRHPAYIEGISPVVALEPGGEAKVKVVLTLGGELVGRVVDEGNRPVAGARVNVSATRGSFEHSTFSDQYGLFAFSAVPSEVSVALARPDDPTRFVLRITVTVTPGREKEIELTLPEPREAMRLVVMGLDDHPVELAQVQFASLDPKVPLRATRFSNAEGVVEVDDVAGLALSLSVTASGYSPWSEQLGKAPKERTIHLTPGVWINGRVTAVRGRQELSGARVVLVTAQRRDTTYSDALGRYEFRNVPEGEITLRVAHDGFATAERRLQVRGTGRVDRAFDLPDVDLTEGARITGTVRDAEGNPVARARVSLRFVSNLSPSGPLPEGTVLTDAEGRFTLHHVEPGTRTLFAYSANAGRGERRLELLDGEEHDGIDVMLEPAGEPDPLNLAGGGVAVTLGERDTDTGPVVIVVNVAPGSEAERAGVQKGDALHHVDGIPVETMREARTRLNGKAGSDVVLAVTRDGESLRFRVRREPVER